MHSLLILLTSLSLALKPEVQTKIRSLLAPYKKEVGFSLRTLEGKEIFSINGNKKYAPASVAKAVSSACSMWQLGTAFQFETQFGHTGTIKKGVLNGDLVVKGGGDPSFVIEDLKEVLERLQVLFGIREIKGKLIFDLSYFENSKLNVLEGFDGDKGRAFRAQLNAFVLNHNAFSIWIVPTKKPRPDVSILPRDVFPFGIDNKLKTTSKGRYWVNLNYRVNKKTLTLSGTVPSRSSVRGYYRALSNPFESHANLFVRLWRELGGKWSQPKFKISQVPVSFKSLWSHKSRPVSRILLDVNKLSTNLASELVFLGAAANRFGVPVNIKKYKDMMSACLNHYKVSQSKIQLDNASGLSRKALVEPSALTELLSKFVRQDYGPEYLASLSILGRDGTLKDRLSGYEGKARLKSGTLKGKRTLAGYVYPRHGKPLSFALLFRCTSCDRLTKVEDKVLITLIGE